jgi:hypothetical protein
MKQVIYWFTDKHNEYRWVREDDTDIGEQRAFIRASVTIKQKGSKWPIVLDRIEDIK